MDAGYNSVCVGILAAVVAIVLGPGGSDQHPANGKEDNGRVKGSDRSEVKVSNQVVGKEAGQDGDKAVADENRLNSTQYSKARTGFNSFKCCLHDETRDSPFKLRLHLMSHLREDGSKPDAVKATLEVLGDEPRLKRREKERRGDAAKHAAQHQDLVCS